MAEPLPQQPATPASRGPFACRLALKLAEEMLGPVCRQALACLISHGTQQYSELQRAAGLPAAQLRAALLVLLQHSLVEAWVKEEPPTMRGPGPSATLYAANLPRALQSLRVPRFLTHVADQLGPHAAVLARILAEHGRLRWDQLADAAAREAADEAAAQAAEGGGEGEGGPPSPTTLLNTFRCLVAERYVERAPPCTLPPPPQQVHPNARKKKAAPKPGSEEEAALHREQAEAALRREYQQARFQLPLDLATAPIADGDAAGGKRKRGGGDAGDEPAKKRGRRKAAEAVGGGGGGEAEGEQAPVLWRLNYEEFNRRFRNELVADNVKLKFGEAAAAAAEGLLLANARFEHAASVEETVVLSSGDVAAALRRARGPGGAPDMLFDALGELAAEGEWVQSRGAGPGGEQFVLRLAPVLAMARLHELLGALRRKFGDTGMRIWRLLLEKGQLEQKQVADLAMVTKEEAREALYAMLRAGYLGLQDVPRTADRAPSRTFYTWRANAELAVSRMASDLYRAAGNLHARLTHERARRSEVLREGREGGERGRARAVVEALEASLLQLDAQLFLFADV